MATDLYLHQELVLLALRDDKGTSINGFITYGIAGALICELLLNERIAVSPDKKKIVAVVNESPIGESLLDELNQMILESKKPRGLQHWIGKAATIKRLFHRVAETLCVKGILQEDERKILFVFTQKVYPELKASFEDEIRQRMANIMFEPKAIADDRTSILIALANHSSLLNWNFAKGELVQHKKRIKELVKGDNLKQGGTDDTLDAVRACIDAAAMVPVLVAANMAG